MIIGVLEEHLEEAEVLWSRRRAATRSAAIGLAELHRLESRLDAHLDGAALGARSEPSRGLSILGGSDRDGSFVATATLLRSGALSHLVFDGFDRRTAAAREGIVDALSYEPLGEYARQTLEEWSTSRSTAKRVAALEVLSFHRALDPSRLGSISDAAEPSTRRTLARAAGRVGAPAELIESLASDSNDRVRVAALDAAAWLGLPWVRDRLRAVCEAGPPMVDEIALLACIADRTDVARVAAWLRWPGLGEAALAAVSTLGFVEGIPVMLEAMAVPPLERAAGQAFQRLCGIGLPPLPAGDEEDDIDFEDLRPVPDASKAHILWTSQCSHFAGDMRWRAGVPLCTEWWIDDLDRGDLLTRQEEITRLRATRPGAIADIELEAPAQRQRGRNEAEGRAWFRQT